MVGCRSGFARGLLGVVIRQLGVYGANLTSRAKKTFIDRTKMGPSLAPVVNVTNECAVFSQEKLRSLPKLESTQFRARPLHGIFDRTLLREERA